MSSSSTSAHARRTAFPSALLSGEPLERRLNPNAFWAEQKRELHWDEPMAELERKISAAQAQED